METSGATLKGWLEQRGLRPSFHRIKVLEYLHRVGGHPAVEDIYSSLADQIPSLSRATIYNTLNAFVACGLVHVISIDGIEKRYDVTLEHHGHFKCEHCGTIYNFKIDIDHFRMDDLAQYEIHDKNVFFTGLCPTCSHNNL